jgi:hypothetical protein
MATSYKVLGNLATDGDLNTFSTLYVCPLDTSAVISTITVCNQTDLPHTYKIGLDESEGTPGISEFIAFGATVPANDTIALTLGLTLDEGKHLRVSSTSASVSIIAFGSEIDV